MTLEERFSSQLCDIGITAGSTLISALSGGGDSVALTLLLARCCLNLNISVHTARVSHGLRDEGEDAAERRLCRDLSKRFGFPYTDLILPPHEVQTLARDTGCGIEQAARTCRMRALENFAHTINADFILFGHTADDQLETLIMRLFSASGPEGLKGISLLRGRRCRPLLKQSRRELRLWLRENGIRWAEDSSNQSAEYRRNRIRNQLIPLLSDIFPGWESALFTLSEKSQEVAGALESLQKSHLKSTRQGKKISWNLSDWEAVAPYLRARAIWEGIDLLGHSSEPDRRVPWKAVTDARFRLEKDGIWNGYAVRFRRLEKIIEATPLPDSPGFGRIVIERDGLLPFERVEFSVFAVEFGSDRMDNAKIHAVKDNQWPLILTFKTQDGQIKTRLHGRGEKITEVWPSDSIHEGTVVYFGIRPL